MYHKGYLKSAEFARVSISMNYHTYGHTCVHKCDEYLII